jgi:catechol 2,3-dioxygenase-like lactoylglutathione lyase family enzyme
MNFQSVVVNVADLDRSIEFYRDVLGFTLLTRKDQLAAVYAEGNDRSQVIVFRCLGPTGHVGGARHVGIRALILEVDVLDELERIAVELQKRDALVSRHGGDTWTAAFGRDPDRIAVVAGCSLTGDPIPIEAWAALDESLYGLGE